MLQEGPASLQNTRWCTPFGRRWREKLAKRAGRGGGVYGRGRRGRGVRTSPAMSNRSEARAKWQTREMQQLRGEGCAAVLTEDDVVMAVSEGVTREREREKHTSKTMVRGRERRRGPVTFVTLCTPGGFMSPRASGTRTHTHAHTHWIHARAGKLRRGRTQQQGRWGQGWGGGPSCAPTVQFGPHARQLFTHRGWSLLRPGRYCGEASLGHKRVQV